MGPGPSVDVSPGISGSQGSGEPREEGGRWAGKGGVPGSGLCSKPHSAHPPECETQSGKASPIHLAAKCWWVCWEPPKAGGKLDTCPQAELCTYLPHQVTKKKITKEEPGFSNTGPRPSEAQEYPSRVQSLHVSVLSRQELWQRPSEEGRVHPSLCRWRLSHAHPASAVVAKRSFHLSSWFPASCLANQPVRFLRHHGHPASPKNGSRQGEPGRNKRLCGSPTLPPNPR